MPDNTFHEQAKTLADANRLLKKYHKCALIRPTGFGKTWLLTELIKHFKSALYLYPTAVIRDTVVDRYYDLSVEDDDGEPLDPETIETQKSLSQIPGCDLMTYAKLIRLSDDDIARMDYDIVVFDEAHRMGGPKTKTACDKLFAMLPEKTRFIGATATPTRMDNFDMASHFFADRLCYAYTLHDAIQSGLIMKPNYCYATYDFRKDLEDEALSRGEDLKDRTVSRVIDAKLIELGKLFNMPNVIRETCDKYAVSTDYMKFIVFFASMSHMDEKLSEVQGWFREAYPDHKVQTLRISSRNAEESANTDKLPLLSAKPKTIDLIACIDMLNVGYHVPDQTGILMYRGTKSNTIFTQQLGRALCAGTGSSGIIFDIVDNLHRKAVYELYVKPNAGARKRRQVEPALDRYVLDRATGNVMMETPGGLVQTQYHYDGTSVKDRHGHKSTFQIAPDGTVKNMSDPVSPEKDVNRIDADCLVATGHEATYREILAKAMAESLSHRCKYALQLHFRSWCLNRNLPYPTTEKELADDYDVDIADFYDEFKRVIREKKIAYPLQDAEHLLAVGNDGSMDAPLSICCDATGASIEALLDLLFA